MSIWWWVLGGVCIAVLIAFWSVAILISTGHWPWEE